MSHFMPAEAEPTVDLSANLFVHPELLGESEVVSRGEFSSQNLLDSEVLPLLGDVLSQYLEDQKDQVDDEPFGVQVLCMAQNWILMLDFLLEDQAVAEIDAEQSVRKHSTFNWLSDRIDDVGDMLEFDQTPYKNYTEIIDALAQRYLDFREQTETRRPELNELRQRFSDRMHSAIDTQGLPLTHRQLESRLEGAKLGFADPLRLGRGLVGVYSPDDRRAHINIDTEPQDMASVVFHELLHAVSSTPGDEDKDPRIGLEQTSRQRLWLNEAVTDLMAYLLLDEAGGSYKFDDEVSPLWRAHTTENIWSLIQRDIMGHFNSYYSYKYAAIHSTIRVPSKVLLDAYFKQDMDEFEDDSRIGTHAERELQRAMKRAGGIGRIAVMRQINDQYEVARELESEEQWNDSAEKKTTAEQLAEEINDQDMKTGIFSNLRRRARSRAVDRHTERYQQRNAAARDWLASRG